MEQQLAHNVPNIRVGQKLVEYGQNGFSEDNTYIVTEILGPKTLKVTSVRTGGNTDLTLRTTKLFPKGKWVRRGFSVKENSWRFIVSG